MSEDVADGRDDERRRSLLEGLAREYAPALRRFFGRRLDDRNDVPDLVQEVFVRLSALKDPMVVKRPEQYLFAAASSALTDRARRNAVRHREKHDLIDEDLQLDSGFCLEHVLARRAAMIALQSVVEDMPVRTRDVFILRTYEELKVREIARLLGISTRAVEKHYARALMQVTVRLEGYRDV